MMKDGGTMQGLYEWICVTLDKKPQEYKNCCLSNNKGGSGGDTPGKMYKI